jgi:hypothetical protein
MPLLPLAVVLPAKASIAIETLLLLLYWLHCLNSSSHSSASPHRATSARAAAELLPLDVERGPASYLLH